VEGRYIRTYEHLLDLHSWNSKGGFLPVDPRVRPATDWGPPTPWRMQANQRSATSNAHNPTIEWELFHEGGPTWVCLELRDLGRMAEFARKNPLQRP